MANRTQIVCLCEGTPESIDKIFYNSLIKRLSPKWLRKQGSSAVRFISCGGRTELIEKIPDELKSCLANGAATTLVVCADCNSDCASPDDLVKKIRAHAEGKGISAEQFEQIVFMFAKDRLENWIEFLATGETDEMSEGPRIRSNRCSRDLARELAKICKEGHVQPNMPPSLKWSCDNWKKLSDRMRD